MEYVAPLNPLIPGVRLFLEGLHITPPEEAKNVTNPEAFTKCVMAMARTFLRRGGEDLASHQTDEQATRTAATIAWAGAALSSGMKAEHVCAGRSLAAAMMSMKPTAAEMDAWVKVMLRDAALVQ